MYGIISDNETERQGYSLFAGFVEEQYSDIGPIVPTQSNQSRYLH